jgi:hypothetical protein
MSRPSVADIRRPREAVGRDISTGNLRAAEAAARLKGNRRHVQERVLPREDRGAPRILVTGAAGGVGGVARVVVGLLRQRDVPVRAFVHRQDERAEALRALGAELIVGDLLRPPDVAEALDTCRRMFFCMTVSPSYLEAATTVATVARSCASLEAVVNLSQLTVSQMTPVSTDQAHHQRLHWLAEQVLDWSTLPVVHVRPTALLENPVFSMLAARSVADHGVIRCRSAPAVPRRSRLPTSRAWSPRSSRTWDGTWGRCLS